MTSVSHFPTFKPSFTFPACGTALFTGSNISPCLICVEYSLALDTAGADTRFYRRGFKIQTVEGITLKVGEGAFCLGKVLKLRSSKMGVLAILTLSLS